MFNAITKSQVESRQLFLLHDPTKCWSR
ncbi:hypothetical protein [Dubosiella newyorkensis]